jgi:hypothetical protein
MFRVMLWAARLMGSPAVKQRQRKKNGPNRWLGPIIFRSETLQHHPPLRGFSAFLGVPLVGGAVRDRKPVPASPAQAQANPKLPVATAALRQCRGNLFLELFHLGS